MVIISFEKVSLASGWTADRRRDKTGSQSQLEAMEIA